MATSYLTKRANRYGYVCTTRVLHGRDPISKGWFQGFGLTDKGERNRQGTLHAVAKPLEACGMLRLRIALQLNVNLPRHLGPPEPRGMLRLRISLQLNVNLLRHQHRRSLNAGEAREVFYPSK